MIESLNWKWLALGICGQMIFFSRFVVQWIASEKAGKSIIPKVFWYLSLSGGLLLFIYSVHRKDLVFMIGNLTGFMIYSRNIWLIYKARHLPSND